MKIGAHLSIAKGLPRACVMAEETGSNTFQFFTRNPRGGRARAIDDNEIKKFFAAREKSSISPIVGHLPYTVNMAAAKPDTYNFAAMVVDGDIERANMIGAEYLVAHPGRHEDKEKGIRKIVALLNKVSEKLTGSCVFLLESMIGRGTEIGDIKDIRTILEEVDEKKFGVCLDSCHLFAAGWDFRDKRGLELLKENLEKSFGLDRVKAFYLNDSKYPYNSGKDRHARIKEGFIGEEGLGNIVNDDFFKNLPFILETPVKDYIEYGEEINRVLSLVK